MDRGSEPTRIKKEILKAAERLLSEKRIQKSIYITNDIKCLIKDLIDCYPFGFEENDRKE